MQVKVQTVSELTINQLSDDQYLAEKAAGRINAGEVYACTPSPVKWEDIQNKPDVSGGGDVDFQELARRIPSWQWKVTLPETVNQTVTATIGSQTYTRDFYAQQGSQIAFSVTPDPGYIAGIVSPKSVTLTSDLTTVTVTEATESGDVEAGTKTFRVNGDGFTVPPAVHVLKWTWDGKDIYTKVIPGDSFGVVVMSNPYPDMPNKPAGFYYSIIDLGGRNKDLFSDLSSEPLSVAWSQEINEHAFDYDWTK